MSAWRTEGPPPETRDLSACGCLSSRDGRRRWRVLGFLASCALAACASHATNELPKQPGADATSGSSAGAPAVGEPAPPLAPVDRPPPGAAGADLAAAVVNAADRSPEDREKDALRKPLPLLTFLDLSPGMRIADLGAGSGYTTELLARAVGAQGRVYAQNIRYVLERFVKKSWPARLEKPVMANVVRVDSELDAPLPEQARDLDVVTMIFFYHDAVAQEVDMAIMNAAIFEALKPGGTFVIADHMARPGSGTADTKELHRIDPDVVKQQVIAAGFELVDEADFLRDPEDTHDWKVFERGFQTDRFVLKFRKPL